MNTKAKKGIKITVDVLLWVFLAFALLMTILAFMAQANTSGYPRIGNTMYFYVKSDSMEGPDGFKKGDLIYGTVLTEQEKQNLKVGDVISYFVDLNFDGIKEINTHRIVAVNTDGTYMTKGDHNNYIDQDNGLPKVNPEDIQAIWAKGDNVHGLGAFLGFLQSSDGFFFCIVLPLLVFFIYELFVLIKTITAVKNKDKKLITAEDEELIKQRAIEEYLAKQNTEADKNDTSPSDN